MPNSLLKSIFGRRRDRDRSPSPSPPPDSYRPELSSQLSIGTIASALGRELDQHQAMSRPLSGFFNRGHAQEDDRMRALVAALHELQVERDENNVTPYTTPDGENDITGTIRKCQEAVGAAEMLLHLAIGREGESRELLLKLLAMLEGQKGELFELSPLAQDVGLPALRTLQRLYDKAVVSLEDAARMRTDEAINALSTLVDVFSEGPDYLIDVIIIETIIVHADRIDEAFGARIRDAFNQALTEQNQLVMFRRAARSILAIATDLAEQKLRGRREQEAYRAIGLLVRQLQARVDITETASDPSAAERLTISEAGSGTKSSESLKVSSGVAPPSVSNISLTSGSATPGDYQSYSSASELQNRFGTGLGSATPSVLSPVMTPRPPPSPAVSDSSDSSEQELWEYKGQILTRSALSLVLRQEALAMADSSGAYTGQVSWDDVRKAWIPRWAEKLKPEDVPDGEVPDTNPANFKVRQKDVWGNQIGWMNGIMYYEEDPTFELRE